MNTQGLNIGKHKQDNDKTGGSNQNMMSSGNGLWEMEFPLVFIMVTAAGRCKNNPLCFK